MRPEKKKAQRQSPAPTTQSNYSRLNDLCLLLCYGSTAVLLYAHFKHMHTLFYFMLGVVLTSLLFQIEILYGEKENIDDN